MSDPSHATAPPTIVVVGGGFGGIEVVRRLRGAPVDVVLIDRQNHFLFQPLLYQVATAVLAPVEIAFPIRRLFRDARNVWVFQETVLKIDRVEQSIHLASGRRARYDVLVLAAGASTSYHAHPEWAQHAPGMKSIEDAIAIRSRVLRAFEDAEAETDPEAMRAHLTFVIVGGGPTGVELAGAIKELAVDAISRDFRRFDARTARVVLVQGADRLLPGMSEESSAAALESLRRIGVEVRLGAHVTEVFEGGVRIGEDRLLADTVVWAAGVAGHALAGSLDAPLDPHGRVLVEPDCSVPGSPNVFVIGDMAAQRSDPDGRAVPGVAPAAIQMGRMVGEIIAAEAKARRDGRPRPARPRFRYHDRGSMATIGRAKAVADLGGLRLRGLVAWLAWLFIHLLLLVGVRNRLFVLLSWGFAYFSFSKSSRTIYGNVPSRVRSPLGARPDEGVGTAADAAEALRSRL